MFGTFVHFASEEDGAITVDWVVLTAAVVGIAIVFMVPITQSASETGVFIAGKIDSAQN